MNFAKFFKNTYDGCFWYESFLFILMDKCLRISNTLEQKQHFRNKINSLNVLTCLKAKYSCIHEFPSVCQLLNWAPKDILRHII